MWLYRPLDGLETHVKVVQWLDGVEPMPTRSLNHFVSFEDETPPHPVIYAGPIRDLERYRAMSQYTWGLAFPASVFESDPDAVVLPLTMSTREAAHIVQIKSSGPSCSTSSAASTIHAVPCMSVLLFFCFID